MDCNWNTLSGDTGSKRISSRNSTHSNKWYKIACSSRLSFCISACSWRESNHNWKHIMNDRDWVSGSNTQIHTERVRRRHNSYSFGWYKKLASLCVSSQRPSRLLQLTTQFSSFCANTSFISVAVAVAISHYNWCLLLVLLWIRFSLSFFLSSFHPSLFSSSFAFIVSIRFECCCCCLFYLLFHFFFSCSLSLRYMFSLLSHHFSLRL